MGVCACVLQIKLCCASSLISAQNTLLAYTKADVRICIQCSCSHFDWDFVEQITVLSILFPYIEIVLSHWHLLQLHKCFQHAEFSFLCRKLYKFQIPLYTSTLLLFTNKPKLINLFEMNINSLLQRSNNELKSFGSRIILKQNVSFYCSFFWESWINMFELKAKFKNTKLEIRQWNQILLFHS